MYKFIKKYLNCNIIETLQSYIITNEHGRTIGEALTMSGAEAIAENYKEKTAANVSPMTTR